jgi:hypothetical protein
MTDDALYEYGDAYLEGKEEVFTTGFPRCGNTWLDRILSAMLGAALQTKPGEVIEYFGSDHAGDYVVRKTHFYANQYTGIGYSGLPAKMVWIQRDPRDMAVSVMYYRGVEPDLTGVMESIFLDKHIPGVPVIGYRFFMEGWLNSPHYDVMVKYEDLHEKPVPTLQHIYKTITGGELSDEDAEGISYRQRFDRWKSRYAHSMRKGVVGDWRTGFRRRHGSFITAAVGDIMLDQGYIDDLDWWKELPE